MAAIVATHPPGRSPGPRDRADDRDPQGTIQFREGWVGAGFTSVSNLVLRSPRLNPTAKVVYGLLLSYAWERGRTWPGQEALAAHMGTTTRTVRNALADLKAVGLITVEQRGLRQTNVYWVEPLERFARAGGPSAEPTAPEIAESGARFRSDRKNFSGQERQLVSGQERQKIAAKEDSRQEHPREQHHHPPAPPATLALPSSTTRGSVGAVDVVALLLSHGVTRRIAEGLATDYPQEAIRQQVEWHGYRPTAKNPVGALVQAVRDGWAPPRAWREAQEREAALARQAQEQHAQAAAEEEARRRREAVPAEERVRGRLEFWLTGQRRKGREPDEAAVAAKRAGLLAQLGADTGSDQGAATALVREDTPRSGETDTSGSRPSPPPV